MPERRLTWTRLVVQISPQEREQLERMLKTGLWGFTLEETAERLLAEGLLRRWEARRG